MLLTYSVHVDYSVHDVARHPEAFYHGLLLAILLPQRVFGYHMESNREHGKGRFDLLILPPADKPGVIIELKRLDGTIPEDHTELHDKLQAQAGVALEQIKSREYWRGLPSTSKKAYLYGMAFHLKHVAVVGEEVDLSTLPTANLGEN